MQRRITAAALRYGVDPKAIEAGLLVDVGRESKIRLVEQGRNGLKIAVPVIEDIIAGIRANSIGVMTIDPFVASHEVTENDNMAIERVVGHGRKSPTPPIARSSLFITRAKPTGRKSRSKTAAARRASSPRCGQRA